MVSFFGYLNLSYAEVKKTVINKTKESVRFMVFCMNWQYFNIKMSHVKFILNYNMIYLFWRKLKLSRVNYRVSMTFNVM